MPCRLSVPAAVPPPPSPDESPLSPSRFGLLRWWPPVLAGGTYVDEGLYTALGSAIQRFDARTLENENGFFDLFGVALFHGLLRLLGRLGRFFGREELRGGVGEKGGDAVLECRRVACRRAARRA